LRASSLYLKHFCLNRFPFRQQPDPEVFFAEAGRSEILQNLCADIAAGKPLLRLTGGEGTGKTLFSMLLARKLGIKKFEVVSVDHPVGSFEDLLRIICCSLNKGRERAPDEEQMSQPGAGHLPELMTLLTEKSRAGHRVVLLIDEAEQLFMATLERLVRLIADIGQDKLLQIVLIGRPELEKNLQQLSSYCEHVDIQAGYTLLPLALQETGKYLCFRLVEAGGAPEKVQEIFSEEAICALHQAAKGNLGLTNLLAEQGLVSASDAGMFRVEAALVSPREERGRAYSSDFAPVKAWLQRYRFQAVAGSLLLALLLTTFWPKEEKPVPPLPPVEQVRTDPNNEPASANEEKMAPGIEAAGQKAAGAPPSPKEKPAVAPAVEPSSAAADRSGTGIAVGEGMREERAPEGLAAENPSPARTSSPPPAPDPLPVPLPEPAAAAPSPDPSPGGGGAAAESFSNAEKKIAVLRPEARKRKPAGTADAAKPPAGNGAKDQEQLFVERLSASAKWRSRSGYTIQLMALASETAEENFKDLLAQNRYAAVKEHLYVVRKAVPPTLFVFYGFFETMESARLARDRLPDFLLDNHPYSLSIDQALKKAKE
jgi:type II secretory pathway predicted ATPase ExeA/septal ring-binding cell division protein DamX